MALAHFELDDGKIIINGQDVTADVAEFQLRGSAGTAPEIWVRQGVANLQIEGDGIVKIIPDDDRQSIEQFLNTIDPKQWEQDTMESLGYGDGDNIMVAALRKLKEYAGAGNS